ncbi:type II toxin-antitoxin system PemK/MazF family toxin [Nostoc sp.]
MVVKPYIPDRADIVKLDCGTAKQITADSIRRVLALKTSGISFEDIAETVNTELKPQGREQMGYCPFLVMSPLKYNRMASIVLICPITNQKKGLRFEVPLPDGMITSGVVLADQIKSLDWKARKVLFVEKVEQELIEEVQAKIKTLIL